MLALAFVWHARRADEPFLPLSLMSGSVVPYAMAAGGCALGAMLGLTVHMPLYYEAVYHLSASESGLALIPLAAVSTGGAAIAGKAMARMKHYKRVAIIGTAFSAVIAAVLAVATPMPLWALLVLLSLFAFGLGTTFPISVVSIQNSVHACPSRHRHRRAELFPRAGGVLHGGRVHRDSADGAGHRHFARRGAQRGECDRARRHGHGVPLRARRGGGDDGRGDAADGADGGEAAGGTGERAGGDGGVGGGPPRIPASSS